MQIVSPKDPFDAIVVGSGATGGWAAKQLTEAGMRVALLEAGGKVTPRDFTEHQQHAGRVDAWGIPVLRMHIEYSDNEKKLWQDAANRAAR